jgi:hypothetical protein
MRSSVLHNFAKHQFLRERLRSEFPEAGNESLQLSVEGISSLPETLASVPRSHLDDLALATALRTRVSEMRQLPPRLDRS